MQQFNRRRNTTAVNQRRMAARTSSGRPKGTYKYFIPGKGNVSVFEYKKYLTNQKQIYRMQLEQQRAMAKIAQRFQNKYNPQIPQQIQQQMIAQQMQRPPNAQPVQQIQPNPFKEISIIERTPINLAGIELIGKGQTFQPVNETFEETNLLTGISTLRRRDGGFI